MRIALGIEYDGSAYVGWQRQDSGIGVQARVEAAVSEVADGPVEVTCAGRTDAGVHAQGQVGHFDTTSHRSTRGWLLGINSNLPDDVNVSWVRPVSDDFHARFSAASRTYEYCILNRLVRSSLARGRAWWVHEALDATRMQVAADALLGENDFSAFRAAGCQASTPVRDLQRLSVTRNGSWIRIAVTANAFLQHMVRNITGTLVEVGRGERPVNWTQEVLLSRDRRQAGVAAPPQGLTLVSVQYPESFGLPHGSADTAFDPVYDSAT